MFLNIFLIINEISGRNARYTIWITQSQIVYDSPQNIHKSLSMMNNDLITIPYYHSLGNNRFLVIILIDHAIIKLSAEFVILLIDKQYHLRISTDIIGMEHLQKISVTFL